MILRDSSYCGAQPVSGDTVYTPSVTLVGRTEPGTTLDVIAEASGDDVPAAVGSDGDRRITPDA